MAAFANPDMADEWISRNPQRMRLLVEQYVAQNLVTGLENIIKAEYQSPEALRAAYTAALALLKGTYDDTAINYLTQQLAALG